MTEESIHQILMIDVPEIRHFFIDEAGDLSLFNKRKVPLQLGTNGVSRFFTVGFVEIIEPERLSSDLEALRQDLLKDPTLANVPSMEKSAVFFHAKDDFVAVRREVFSLLEKSDIKFWAIVRDKLEIQNQGIFLYKQFGKKITDKEIYGQAIQRLSKYLLHKSHNNKFVFAERGKTFTNKSLAEALKKTEDKIRKQWGVEPHGNNDITCGHPKDFAGLQVVDYCLWALQRLYERGEDYYFEKMSDKYRLIMDLDDTRNKPYGEWYSQKAPLDLTKLPER